MQGRLFCGRSGEQILLVLKKDKGKNEMKETAERGMTPVSHVLLSSQGGLKPRGRYRCVSTPRTKTQSNLVNWEENLSEEAHVAQFGREAR